MKTDDGENLLSAFIPALPSPHMYREVGNEGNGCMFSLMWDGLRPILLVYMESRGK